MSQINTETLKAIEVFVSEVERRAEVKILKTNKLEGSHYAAMKEVLEEYQALITLEHWR
jgi:hypothetical protein